MKKRLLLVLIGGLVTLSCYSQNPNRDTDRNEYQDSTVSSDTREWDVDTDGSDDTTELAVPSGENRDSDVSLPSKGTASPGMSGKGAYDVDGKVNGKLDAKKKKKDQRNTTPKNNTTGRDVD